MFLRLHLTNKRLIRFLRLMLFVMAVSPTWKHQAQAAELGIRVASWNAKHLGRKEQDYAASAILLQDSDLIAIQEVNKTPSGIKGLQQLVDAVSTKAGTKYCSAVSDIPTDSLERYAMMWREDRLSYVTTAGKTIDGCPKFLITMPVIKEVADQMVREPAYATFKMRQGEGKITVITVHLVPTAKKPAMEVEPLFKGSASLPGKWCRLVVGDFNLSSDHPSMKAGHDLGFEPAFAGEVKTSIKKKDRGYSMAYDNVWWRGCASVTGQAVGNPGILGMSQADVFNKVSDHMPVSVSVTP